MLFPLWAKLGLIFGGLTGVFLAGYGWMNFQADLAYEEERRKDKLLGLAHALADHPGLGEQVANFTAQADAKRPEYEQIRDWIYSAREAIGVSWTGITTKDAQDRFSFIMDSSRSAPLPVGYPIFDGAEKKLAAWHGKDALDPELEDDFGLWIMAYAPIKDRNGNTIALLEVADDANARSLFADERGTRLAWQLGLAVLLSILLAVLFARYINRYLRRLTTTAQEVAGGNLTPRVEIPTHDEIGLLGDSFNAMIEGLQEREFIRDTFGRFVSQEVMSEVLKSTTVKLGGEEREVTVLMSDLRGFTSLSIALGPEAMVQLLNRYFTACPRSSSSTTEPSASCWAMAW